jgi:hypothetical protein
MMRKWRERPKREAPQPARWSLSLVAVAIALAAAVIVAALLLAG